jgi:6-phosphofructokinase 1
MTVSGWVSRPGADLGTSRYLPEPDDLARIAANLAAQQIDGLLMIGGWSGYVAAHRLQERAVELDGLAVPIVCVPASINNDLPGTDLSIGADTALNNIVTDVDKIKQSAVAVHRCFIVEVMGRDCGYLALMSALATGAERVYLPEEGITLRRIQDDLEVLRAGFAVGKRRGLVIRSEHADPSYTTSVLHSLFSRESGGRFDVRSAVLGHVQQGGSPTPFDRIMATRLAAAGIEELIAKVLHGDRAGTMVGLRDGLVELTPLAAFPDLVEPGAQRPRGPAWWTALRPLVDLMGQADAR